MILRKFCAKVSSRTRNLRIPNSRPWAISSSSSLARILRSLLLSTLFFLLLSFSFIDESEDKKRHEKEVNRNCRRCCQLLSTVDRLHVEFYWHAKLFGKWKAKFFLFSSNAETSCAFQTVDLSRHRTEAASWGEHWKLLISLRILQAETRRKRPWILPRLHRVLLLFFSGQQDRNNEQEDFAVWDARECFFRERQRQLKIPPNFNDNNIY